MTFNPAGDALADDMPHADDRPHRRHRGIDGWRAIAAGFVVFSHAINFRFTVPPGAAMHLVQRVSGPLAQIGVQLFFVISGFIITSLMLREETKRGRVSIAAFYARRFCRILPPLLAYFAAVGLLTATGALTLPADSFASAATFTCNIGFVDCDWWVAHTWSLAVEEQFYLAWPLLIVLAPPRWRVPLLIAALIGCTIGISANPFVFHSNYTSFGCIAAGALYALSPVVRQACQRATATPLWLAAIALLVLGPLTRLGVIAIVSLPFLVTYIIFAGNALRWVRAILEWRVLQIIGAGSYSLYLWQQLFLAPPAHYTSGPFPIVLLPIVVLLSVYLVERPFIHLGRRLSRRFEGAPG
ncbi:MAG: acyltransferase [Sphingomonas phyllosphaerae]